MTWCLFANLEAIWDFHLKIYLYVKFSFRRSEKSQWISLSWIWVATLHTPGEDPQTNMNIFIDSVVIHWVEISSFSWHNASRYLHLPLGGRAEKQILLEQQAQGVFGRMVVRCQYSYRKTRFDSLRLFPASS